MGQSRPATVVRGDAGREGRRGLSREVRGGRDDPGTGEYSLATEAVSYDLGRGETQVINRNTPIAGTDFQASMQILGQGCRRWFGLAGGVVVWGRSARRRMHGAAQSRGRVARRS